MNDSVALVDEGIGPSKQDEGLWSSIKNVCKRGTLSCKLIIWMTAW